MLGAGAALALALHRRPAETATGLRAAPPLLLAALGAFGALSAAWTVASPSDALRWALVLIALAAVMGVAAGSRAPRSMAMILLFVAVGAAVAGDVGALGHYGRIGLNICGHWRPAGPFEYPPALALACTAALPPAVWAMLRTTGWQSAAASAAGWLLAATIALSGTRLQVALEVLALLAAAAWLPDREERGSAPAAATLVAAGAGVSALLVGRDLGDDPALLSVGAVVAGALVVVAWPLLRREPARLGRAPWLAAVAIIGIAGVAGSTAAERLAHCQGSGFGHGRSGIWAAAIDTARERPLAGHGMESFARASRSHQLEQRAVPVQYAHNLPLEGWVELGVPGVLLIVALYGAVGLAVVHARREAAVLLGPAAIAFLAANLFDWPWHLAGAGMLWAIAVGGLIGAGLRPPPAPGGSRWGSA